MRTVLSLIIVLRPHNVAAAVLSVVVGLSMAGPSGWPFLLLAAVAATTAAGNTINDYYDIDIDSINKPSRPLPFGSLSVRQVLIQYAVLVAAVLVLVSRLETTEALWVIVWVVLLHLYSARLKRVYLAGNILVSVLSASGFLLGALAGGRISAGLVPAAFTFLFILGREMVKDSDDMEGDRTCGAATIPIVSGKRAALAAAAVIFAILSATFPLPYLLGLYDRSYIFIMIFSVIPILAVSIVLTTLEKRLGLVSSLLKSGMFLGMLAFYFGSGGWKG